jgi:phage N-6-adenine-methyltransferase
MTELVKYNAACRALAEARSVDEVKDVRDKAMAIQTYAKQAKNRQLEVDAIEIRVRAERRLGEMLAQAPKAKNRPGPGRGKAGSPAAPALPSAPPTLAELGIGKKLSARSQKAAAMPEPVFQGKLANWRKKAEADEDGAIHSDPLATKAHVANNSGDNEWYTPAEIIKAARQVMDSIDLDPASSEEANAVVKAATFFTAEQDGLKQTWKGAVWLNPPFAGELIGRFAQKLVDSEQVTQAVVLVNNATETRWFQLLLTKAACLCLPAGRVKFWHPRKDSAMPLQGQAILYFGPHKGKFHAQFKHFGAVCDIVR